jgi:hypothetical protein
VTLDGSTVYQGSGQIDDNGKYTVKYVSSQIKVPLGLLINTPTNMPDQVHAASHDRAR